MGTEKQQAKVDKRAAAVVRRTLKAALKDPVVQTDPRCVALCEAALEVMDSGQPDQWAAALVNKVRGPAASSVLRTAKLSTCARAGCKNACRLTLFGRSSYCVDHQPGLTP